MAREGNSQAVVSYRNSTSNHNAGNGYPVAALLYLIEILHQTTTKHPALRHSMRCILSKFYIKPQLRNVSLNQDFRCILSKFYIKPQLVRQPLQRRMGCILSKFYIKPQRRSDPPDESCVVSYRNSTSNHNRRASY